MKEFKELVKEGLKGFLGDYYPDATLERLIQPSKGGWGDFSFPCFTLAKEWDYGTGKADANALAKDIAETVAWDPVLSASVAGGYLNLSIEPHALIESVIASSADQAYGSNASGKGKMVVLDYSAPNLGKPLHVGHIRSTILGDSIAKILRFNGFSTHGINYLGDVGLHIGKILAAYERWGDPEAVKKDPEKGILDLYVSFSKQEDEGLRKLAQDYVEKVEREDPEAMEVLSFIRSMSMQAFDKVYRMLDVSFDEVVGQSSFSSKGKEIVQSLLDSGVAYRDGSGAVIAGLEKYGMGDKVILRSDGTAIYSTQDLGAAHYRKERYRFDRMLYVVGKEQEYYFKQIFKILEVSGQDWYRDCRHIAFGMINLEDGKMSTREGKIVHLEEVLDKAIARAYATIAEKNPDLADKDEVARMVGVGAMKYMALSVDYPTDIQFSWERALDLSGNSSVYIQYNHARAKGIMRRSRPGSLISDALTGPSAYGLVRKIAEFPRHVESAGREYRPHIIANYAQELSVAFNDFYKNEKVLGTEDEASKAALVGAYAATVRSAMALLGIGVPDVM